MGRDFVNSKGNRVDRMYEVKKLSSPSTRHGGAWRERRFSYYSFTISALDGGEWSASRPGRALPPGKGGWVGPRAGLDTEDIGKILCPCRGSNPDRPVVQRVVRHYTAWATPAPCMKLSKDITNCYDSWTTVMKVVNSETCTKYIEHIRKIRWTAKGRVGFELQEQYLSTGVA
jgi:hypothetical protein